MNVQDNIKLAKIIVNKNLSVRQAEFLVKKEQVFGTLKKIKSFNKVANIKSLENELEIKQILEKRKNELNQNRESCDNICSSSKRTNNSHARNVSPIRNILFYENNKEEVRKKIKEYKDFLFNNN